MDHSTGYVFYANAFILGLYLVALGPGLTVSLIRLRIVARECQERQGLFVLFCSIVIRISIATKIALRLKRSYATVNYIFHSWRFETKLYRDHLLTWWWWWWWFQLSTLLAFGLTCGHSLSVSNVDHDNSELTKLKNYSWRPPTSYYIPSNL